MTTIQQAEDRVKRGEAAIKDREASGSPVPNSWLDAYDAAWITLLALVDAEQRQPLVQGEMAIATGRWR